MEELKCISRKSSFLKYKPPHVYLPINLLISPVLEFDMFIFLLETSHDKDKKKWVIIYYFIHITVFIYLNIINELNYECKIFWKYFVKPLECSELGLKKSKNGFPSYSDRQKIIVAYYKQTILGKQWLPKRIDKNRVKLTFLKNWKTAILLYCFHAAGCTVVLFSCCRCSSHICTI